MVCYAYETALDLGLDVYYSDKDYKRLRKVGRFLREFEMPSRNSSGIDSRPKKFPQYVKQFLKIAFSAINNLFGGRPIPPISREESIELRITPLFRIKKKDLGRF